MDAPLHIVSTLFSASWQYGLLAVELFFALSGYGMVLGYQSNIFHSSITFNTYMKKRFLKIYPMFLETTIIAIAVNILAIKLLGTKIDAFFDAYHVFLNIFMLQTGIFDSAQSLNGPAWCLPVFMMMYALFFAIIARMREKYCEKQLGWVFFFVAILGGVLEMTGWQYPVFNQLVGRCTIGFFSGCFLANVFRNNCFTNHTKYFLGYASLFAIVITYLLGRYGGYEKIWGNIQMIVPVALIPLSITAIVNVYPLKYLLSCRPFTTIGNMSMAVYLTHHPLQWLIIILNQALDLSINFSSVYTWVIYVMIVLCISKVNQLFVRKISSSFTKWLLA